MSSTFDALITGLDEAYNKQSRCLRTEALQLLNNWSEEWQRMTCIVPGRSS
jgi:hypothetical protein